MTTVQKSAALLSMTETADRLNVKRRTLLEYWRAWGLTGVRVGRETKFDPADVAAWIAKNKKGL